jgi:hypothetical protein
MLNGRHRRERLASMRIAQGHEYVSGDIGLFDESGSSHQTPSLIIGPGEFRSARPKGGIQLGKRRSLISAVPPDCGPRSLLRGGPERLSDR